MATIEEYRAELKRKIEECNKRICKSGAELEKALNDYAEYAKKDAIYAFYAAVMNAYARLVQRTPVDTGRARAGWHIETEVNEWKPELFEQSHNSKIELQTFIEKEVRKLEEFALSEADKIYIMNNVEYILALEAGHSKQSSGFIALFLEELKTQLQQAVRKL